MYRRKRPDGCLLKYLSVNLYIICIEQVAQSEPGFDKQVSGCLEFVAEVDTSSELCYRSFISRFIQSYT